MPRFWECPDAGDNMYQLDKCTDSTTGRWFYAHMQYPDRALKKNIQGTNEVFVIIDTSGLITKPLLLSHISDELDTETLRLIDLMENDAQRWIPGTQQKKKVKVSLRLFVNFSIDKWNLELARRHKLEGIGKDTTNLPLSPIPSRP